MRRQLNIQPTLTVRPGLPVRVIVNRDLVAYAVILAKATGEPMPSDPAKLVAPMLQRFMATDKGFSKAKCFCLWGSTQAISRSETA